MANEKQSWVEKNHKVLMVAGAVVLVALLLVPDSIIRKIPWVK
jgi:hypothetical protein